MFNKSNFCHIASNNRNDQKGSVFIYKTSDSLSQVTQSGYFNEKLIDINLHDLIIHVQYDPVARTLKKSVLIVTERTMDNVATQPITDETILNDLGDLGEQVAGIEEKIPSNASATNQLATASDINTKITNCITEIPQDIKLELNNGTLTLKAGSKVYVPNGAGVFDVRNINSDTVLSTPSGTNQWLCAISAAGTILTRPLSNCVSGVGATATTGFAYDITANNIGFYNTSGVLQYSNISLPICIITTTDSVITSIDQVFNGFGYIGSTAFVLPSVKGLIPNGRNEDGTLKNIRAISEKVYTYTRTTATNPNIALIMAKGGYLEPSSFITYDAETNINTISGTPTQNFVVGKISFGDGGKITSFEPKTTFHAVDYNDTEFIAHQAMPSDRYIDLTLGASGSAYTAPADGYVCLVKGATDTERITIRNLTTYLDSSSYASGNQNLGVFLPVSKNDSYGVIYSASGATQYFRFFYANGAK